MTTKRDRAIDIAREMARHIDAGSSQEEIDASIRRAFPSVTAELDRARAIGLDQIDQIATWLENKALDPKTSPECST